MYDFTAVAINLGVIKANIKLTAKVLDKYIHRCVLCSDGGHQWPASIVQLVGCLGGGGSLSSPPAAASPYVDLTIDDRRIQAPFTLQCSLLFWRLWAQSRVLL